VPAKLKIEISPSSPTLAMTRFGRTCPGIGFRLAAIGRGEPFGNTVTYDSAVWEMAVTLTMTADTPEAGTPPRPVIFKFIVDAAPSPPPPELRPSTVGKPGRGSSRRAEERPV
jgi:hypothetical protein